MKKKVFLILAIVLAVVLVMIVSTCGNIVKVNNLANWGKEQFAANDYTTYVATLRKAGLYDLQVGLELQFDYKESYDSKTKTLTMTSTPILTSLEIDNYYTRYFEDATAYQLITLMRDLHKSLRDREYTYVSAEYGTVIIKIHTFDHYTITTPDGREYRYLDDGTYASVDIDDDLVYNMVLCEECGEFSWDSIRNPLSGDLEFYCYTHMQKIDDLLEEFGIG